MRWARLILVLLICTMVISGCANKRPESNSSKALKSARITRSTTMNPQIELRFGIPYREYAVDKAYIVEALLTNRSIRAQVLETAGGSRELFDVVVVDKNNRPIVVDEQQVEGDSEGGPGHQSVAIKLQIKFKLPGEYKIYCRLKGAVLKITLGPTGRVTTKPLNLKTEPISIKVR